MQGQDCRSSPEQRCVTLQFDTHSRGTQGALTCVSVRREQARDFLQPRHQKVFRQEVKYRLQGRVGLQGVLQVAVLHYRHVLVL